MKVLIVDNEPRWMKFCLECEYTVIKNITVDDLKKSNFDVYIISDLQPIELIEALHDKKFIISTARPSTKNAIDAYKLGAAYYFVKDFNKDKIDDMLREI